ncbi:MAG: hypothetical protein NTW64_01335 [Candidatus Omnitrophica bacterium]|nr:hypothetical protein [Candidatus Omnitrophota bacterium]
MKKLAFLVVTLAIASSFVFAAEQTANMTLTSMPTKSSMPAQTTVPETMILKGDIIDNMCAGSQKAEQLAEFVKTHNKTCALSCVASGYSIFADGKLQKFDMESNAKIEEFLKKQDSKLQVSVVVKKVGDVLSLVSIENQK